MHRLHRQIQYFYQIIGIVILLQFFCGCDQVKSYLWSRQAQEAHSEGEYQKAIDLYKKLIELEPSDPGHYWDLGIAYFDSGNEEKAREQIGKLRKIGQEEYAKRMEEVFRSSEHVIQRGVIDKRTKSVDGAVGY